jgi:F0F1-type ATP synthase assembly protein I
MAGPGNENPWAGLGIGWAIIATLIAGMLVWGGLGYLLDRLVGTFHVFMAIGTVVGAAGDLRRVPEVRQGATCEGLSPSES